MLTPETTAGRTTRTMRAEEPGALDPRVRRAFAWSGWAAAAVAVTAAAFAVRDAAGVLVLTALFTGGLAVLHTGAPFARSGKPSALRIALLFAAAPAGVVLTVAVGPVVALGVVFLAYAIGVLATSRWPPDAALQVDVSRRAPPPAGAVVAMLGALPAFFAAIAVSVDVVDSQPLGIALSALAGLASARWCLRIVAAYAG